MTPSPPHGTRVARARGPLLIWRWPVVLALLTLVGLLAALLGEHGVWLWVSWTTLSLPLLVIAASVLRAQRQRTGQGPAQGATPGASHGVGRGPE